MCIGSLKNEHRNINSTEHPIVTGLVTLIPVLAVAKRLLKQTLISLQVHREKWSPNMEWE